jgi:hypothetical protein
MDHPEEKKFLESYAGQSVDQLLALESDHRIDSIILAFEQALEERSLSRALTGVERDILSMEREVNNGGFHQFFLNRPEWGALLPSALKRIGCPVTAQIAREAQEYLGLSAGSTPGQVTAALVREGDSAISGLGPMDERYFQVPEPIADRLFLYIRARKSEVLLPD